MLKAELGDMAHTIDEPNAVKRWNAGQLPVMLVHPASAGHGLNLQHGGHTMVWASLPWSLEEYQQTNKRLARNGQQHPVVIHHLLSPGTVDYTVLQALRTKDNIQAALMAHLESPL
jgi:SNF2 family DNA or RNA helicase